MELVRRAGKLAAVPLVNAILRKVNRDEIAWPDAATGLSVPAWLLKRWRGHFGLAAAEKIARAALEEPEAHINRYPDFLYEH